MSSSKQTPRVHKRAPRQKKANTRLATSAQMPDPKVTLAVAKHLRSQQAVLSQLAAMRTNPKGGAFSNLGGDVDSMIEHGQEAWAAVKKMLNVESKAFEYYETSASGNVGTTPLFTDLTALIAQGSSDVTRDGDSLKLNRITGAYTLTGSNDFYRVVVTQATDEALVAADVFASVGTAYSVTSPVAWDTRQQFRVLYDRCHNINQALTGINNFTNHRFEIKEELHVQYLNGSTTVERGCIQIWFVSFSGATAHNLSVQMEFVDN